MCYNRIVIKNREENPESRYIMGRIADLINSFLKPNNTEQNFDEIVLSEGISQADLSQLKRTMDGVRWDWSSEEIEDRKATKGIIGKVSQESEKIGIQDLQTENSKQNNGFER